MEDYVRQLQTLEVHVEVSDHQIKVMDHVVTKQEMYITPIT